MNELATVDIESGVKLKQEHVVLATLCPVIGLFSEKKWGGRGGVRKAKKRQGIKFEDSDFVSLVHTMAVT